MLHGEQGSAKTTLQELIKTLVHPSSILTLAFPRDINEFIQELAHNFIVYFDNISQLEIMLNENNNLFELLPS
jgi:ABC-type Na+ transport system ATPase subunit NatA